MIECLASEVFKNLVLNMLLAFLTVGVGLFAIASVICAIVNTIKEVVK